MNAIPWFIQPHATIGTTQQRGSAHASPSLFVRLDKQLLQLSELLGDIGHLFQLSRKSVRRGVLLF